MFPRTSADSQARKRVADTVPPTTLTGLLSWSTRSGPSGRGDEEGQPPDGAIWPIAWSLGAWPSTTTQSGMVAAGGDGVPSPGALRGATSADAYCRATTSDCRRKSSPCCSGRKRFRKIVVLQRGCSTDPHPGSPGRKQARVIATAPRIRTPRGGWFVERDLSVCGRDPAAAPPFAPHVRSRSARVP